MEEGMGGRMEEGMDGRMEEWKNGRGDGRMFYNLSESRRARNGVERSTIKDECATDISTWMGCGQHQ